MEVLLFSIFTNSLFLEIKPFHLYFNRKELHLDPIHHLLRWINVSRLSSGPLFRRIDSFDRVVMSGSRALVSLSKITNLIHRVRNSLWSTSEIICWTLAKTLHHMELILFVVVAVNISQVKGDGILENYVIGVDGAWTLTT